MSTLYSTAMRMPIIFTASTTCAAIVQHTSKRMPIWGDATTLDAHSGGLSATAWKRRRAAAIRRSSRRRSSIRSLPEITIAGAGGAIAFQPLLQQHGSIHLARFSHRRFCLLQRCQRFPAGNDRQAFGTRHAGDRHAAIQVPPKPSVGRTVARLDRTASPRNTPY